MRLNKYLKYIVTAGLFLVPFIPLIISRDMLFPFITGKNFWFRIIVEIIFAAWLLLMVRDRSYRPIFSYLAGALGLFLVVITIADIFGANPYKSFWSNYERMEGLITHLHLFAYFIVLGSYVKTEKFFERLLQTSLGVSVIMGFYGILQLTGAVKINQGGVRLDATFGNATYLAIYVFFHIFIALFLMARWRGHKAVSYIYGLVVVLHLFILYHTQTRGAMLGLAAGLLVAALLYIFLSREKNTLRKISIGIIVALVVFGGAVLLLRNSNIIKKFPPLERLSSISLKEGTARFRVWNVAWHGVKENPILGWGQEGFNFVFNKYYDPQMYTQEPWFDRTHNIAFDWLVAAGILGFLSYLSILVLFFVVLWKKTQMTLLEKAILSGAIVGYTVHNIFVFDNLGSYIIFFTLLAYVHYRATIDKQVTVSEEPHAASFRLALPVVVLFLTVAIWFGNAKGMLTAKTLIDAMQSHPEGATKNIELFKKALSYNSFGSTETREQLAQMAQSALGADVDNSVKEGFFNLAFLELKKQVEATPEDARYQLFTGVFLSRFGQGPLALPYLEKALELSPKKQSIYYEIGILQINAGKMAEALETFRKAYELAPTSPESRQYYALAAVYAKRSDIAKEVLGGKDYTLDDIFIAAYVKLKDFKKVLEIYTDRLAISPTRENYVGISVAQLKLGNKTKAIEALQKAAEVDPEFKKQADFYIKEIKEGRDPTGSQ
ncbi:MAG TPA: O-antigen ligase family protein [Candidatus Paceibacterota bacterium]